MEEKLIEMMSCGFIAYPRQQKWILDKVATPKDKTNLSFFQPNTEFNSMEEAVEAAIKYIRTPKVLNYNVIIAFDKGLGIQFEQLVVKATSSKEAYNIAVTEANKIFGENKWEEIKVKLKEG